MGSSPKISFRQVLKREKYLWGAISHLVEVFHYQISFFISRNTTFNAAHEQTNGCKKRYYLEEYEEITRCTKAPFNGEQFQL